MECYLTKQICRYSINKRYNYGFVSGSSGWCKLVKKWTSDMDMCPEEAKQDYFETNILPDK
jgi:hypothetical protein